ncbi:MAG: ATP-binding cassette domain-containing protein [Anaerolineae bacterium]|jgi:energy-coupling factor transport system ATP-binding protein
MPRPLIEIENLSFAYETQGGDAVQALSNVSATVNEGVYLAILGPNGSGKSTLAKCLNGLLLPNEGQVRVMGLDTRDRARLLRIRSLVAMAFQNPDNQFVATTVEEEVAFGPENLGISHPELEQRVRSALADTGLAHRAQDNPRLLSAGEKARLAVASLLAMQPRCLVLDESTAMLDPVSRVRMRELLTRLHRQGLTIVLITHYMDEAADAEQVLVLHQGRVALQGSPDEVFAQDERLREIGLSGPPARLLSSGLARRGLPIQPVLTVDDLVATLLAPNEASHG